MKIIVAQTALDAAVAAANWTARRVLSSVRLRGVCRIAVSGGSTPAPMFDALAAMDLPWQCVQLFQVDERVAPDGDPDRNATQLTDHLLRHVEIRRGNVHLMGVGARSLDAAAARYSEVLGTAPLDVVHLGLGDDGHTASWPPDDSVIDSPNAVAISGEYRGRMRMTLTPQVVNGARARLVLAAGESKVVPLVGWLVQRRSDLPIARVRRSGTTLVLDKAAASGLAPS